MTRPATLDVAAEDPLPRIAAIRDALLSEKPSLCLERPTLLREFERGPGRSARNDHPLVHRARIIAFLLTRRKPRIYEHELIIGNVTSKRIAANYYPEGGSVNILEDLTRLDKRPNPINLSTTEHLRLLHLGLRAVPGSIAGRALLRPSRAKHFADFFLASRYFVTEEAGIAHQAGGYRNVIHCGLREADRFAARCLRSNALPHARPLDTDQRAFYLAIRIVIDAIRRMADNLATEAERIASLPATPPLRRQELLRSASACRRVPFEPSRTLLEGLQACWLVHIALLQEDFEQGMSFGRLDQFLIGLYRADLDDGRIDRQAAVELLASFELKTCETMPLYSERIGRYFSGNGVAQGITLGGTDPEGNDVTNELSGLFLEAYAHARTREPALHVRLHPRSPAWFVDRAVSVLQLGCGKPSFFGDDAVVRALESAGLSTPHARDYAVIGCVELASQGRTYNSSDAALLNLALCLELALNQGYRFRSPKLPGFRLGARTKPASDMHTFDDLIDALRAQVHDAADEMCRVISWLEATYRVWRPTPINSLITDGCLERGRDVTWGGALYDLTSIQAVGLADVGDSLYAIDRLIFAERRMSLEALVEVLKRDFAGQERLRLELLRRFPRYGNGDEAADRMTQVALDVFVDDVTARRNSRGGKYVAGVYSMTCHTEFGKHTGALPNGRNAGERLSNGLSPVDGMERCGPTGVLSSAASLDVSRVSNCYALNLKFEASSVQGPRGREVLSALLRGFVRKGGMQVQVNVLDAETLRAARRDPGSNPGIVVRVAGYCAYFADLDPSVQDEIIERTAHGA